MNDYEAIGVYAGFAFIVFFIAIFWRYQREKIRKRFHLLDYQSKNNDPKAPHIV